MLEDQLLDFLRHNQHHFLSGNELSHRLGISRTAIWKHIEHLRKLGYEIEAQPHYGYRLVAAPDRLIPEEIQWNLNTRWIGQKIVSYEETTSTNDVATQLAIQGTPSGTVVFAEFQTKGRGRLGRSWISSKGSGILMSVVFRPKLLPNQAPQMTLMSAVAVAKAIEKQSGLATQVKWPNDLLINHRKVAGILTEMQAETDQIRFLIVGIGMNVFIPPESLSGNATAIHLHLPTKQDNSIPVFPSFRISLAQELLRQLEQGSELLQKGEWGAIRQEWENRSILSGKFVKVHCLTRQIEGVVTGLDPDGALLVRLDHGFVERVVAGDVVSVR